MRTSNSLSNPIIQKINTLFSTRKPWIGKFTKATWIFFLCLILGIPLWVASVNYNVFGLFGEMPSLLAVENPENDLSSELISADGVSLGRYFLNSNRSQVQYDELSPTVVNTLIYSEDHRFYSHAGMDFWAYVRAVYGVLTFNPKGGGSTITQQLAKNLYTQNDELDLDGPLSKLGKHPKRLIQKTKEWIISFYLEKYFTKEEIISMYLNTSTFGNNTYGIKVAAETYFSKSHDNLNIQEVAVLIGLLQGNTTFDPKLHPERSTSKRNDVLRKLRKFNYIKSDAELDSIQLLPIELDFRAQNQNVGLAPYFRSIIQTELKAWCKEHGYNLWNSGLKIYTTIDSRLQTFAEEAVAENMAKQQKDFYKTWKGENPWVNTDNQEIRDFLQSRIKRTDAYRLYKKPCLELADISPQIKVPGGYWWPVNYDKTHGSGKIMTLRQAMARSVNSIAAQLIEKVTPENAVAFAHRVGIQSDLDVVPAICLGVSDVSLYELVGAYGTFVNSGIYTTPYYISRIEDKNGNVIENFTPKRKEAISEQTAYIMVHMLRGGVEEEGGSSQRINSELKKDNEIGGKTGTTDNASDAWYMGVTKDLVSGVWVGGDEPSIHFKSWTDGQGSKTARPIWESYMLKVYNSKDLPYKKGPFKHPERLNISLNCNDYADSVGRENKLTIED